jgi:hypothetical protein
MLHSFEGRDFLDERRRLNERSILAPISATFIQTKNIPSCFVNKLRSSSCYRDGHIFTEFNTGQLQTFPARAPAENRKKILSESEPTLFSLEWFLIVIQMFTLSLVLLNVLRVFAG